MCIRPSNMQTRDKTRRPFQFASQACRPFVLVHRCNGQPSQSHHMQRNLESAAQRPIHTRDELTGRIHWFMDELNQCTVHFHTEFAIRPPIRSGTKKKKSFLKTNSHQAVLNSWTNENVPGVDTPEGQFTPERNWRMVWIGLNCEPANHTTSAKVLLMQVCSPKGDCWHVTKVLTNSSDCWSKINLILAHTLITMTCERCGLHPQENNCTSRAALQAQKEIFLWQLTVFIIFFLQRHSIISWKYKRHHQSC